MFTLTTATRSETGKRRRNEDACGHQQSERFACWIVSDGAGGHGSGDVAAQLTVSTILEDFSHAPGHSAWRVSELLERAHQAVLDKKNQNPDGDNMHATAALLLIDLREGKALWGHVGDTRIYLFRGGNIVHQSRDHSLVQQLIDAGYGSADTLREHPQRNILTAAIGNQEPLNIRLTKESSELEHGDHFLICSDGWWELVDETAMCALLASSTSPESWLTQMAAIIASEEAQTEHGDNYTAIAVRIETPAATAA